VAIEAQQEVSRWVDHAWGYYPSPVDNLWTTVRTRLVPFWRNAALTCTFTDVLRSKSRLKAEFVGPPDGPAESGFDGQGMPGCGRPLNRQGPRLLTFHGGSGRRARVMEGYRGPMTTTPIDPAWSYSSACYEDLHRACINGPDRNWDWCTCPCHTEPMPWED
jgi:hypothetical protein